jgi:hypothetical protein
MVLEQSLPWCYSSGVIAVNYHGVVTVIDLEISPNIMTMSWHPRRPSPYSSWVINAMHIDSELLQSSFCSTPRPACLFFCSHHRFIRLTSPNINYIIIAGAVVFYSSVYTFLYVGTPSFSLLTTICSVGSHNGTALLREPSPLHKEHVHYSVVS